MGGTNMKKIFIPILASFIFCSGAFGQTLEERMKTLEETLKKQEQTIKEQQMIIEKLKVDMERSRAQEQQQVTQPKETPPPTRTGIPEDINS